MVGKGGAGETLEGHIIGVVFVHVDLFDDHLTLRLDLVGPEGRSLDDLREHVEAGGQLLVEQTRPEASRLLRGERIGSSAYGVEGLRHISGRQLLRALEEEMLEEVRNAGL